MKKQKAGCACLLSLSEGITKMDNIKTKVEADDIEWEMDWSGVDENGNRKYPDKPEKEMVFEEEGALALMLLNRVFHVNDHWWHKDWPEDARKVISFNVNCSDIFAWGCSDSEELPFDEIKNLYDLWRKDPAFGHAIWCMIRRREMPQQPVEESIRKMGIWDLEDLKKTHGLRANCYDGIFGEIARHKYEVYADWERSRGNEPVPFDIEWHKAWKLYVEANPDYKDSDWEAEEDRRIEKWKQDNGYTEEAKA